MVARSRIALLVALAGCLLAPARAAAQDPEPAPAPPIEIPIPDQELPGDTFPRAAIRDITDPDTIGPAPVLPVFPRPAPTGYSAGVWEFDREALRAYHGFSLIELLERIPGLVLTRTGAFGMPMGTSVLGTGGGRVRVIMDGYEYDPLEGPTHDLQRIDLVDVAYLRVHRRPDEILLEIDRFRLEDAAPFTEVEAGTGDFRSRILRAFFSRPVLERNVLTVGLDIVDTSGQQGLQPFSATTGFARFDHTFNPDLGLQLEFRQRGDDREGFFAESFSRRDLVLRGRGRFAGGITTDLVAGWGEWRDRAFEPPLGADPDTAFIDVPEERVASRSSTQLGVRGSWDPGPLWGEASARLRPSVGGGLVPRRELRLSGGARLPMGSAEGELREASRGGVAGLEWSAGARLGPLVGASLFARAGGGSRGVPRWLPDLAEPDDPLDPTPIPTGAVEVMEVGSSWQRVGAEWEGWGAQLGVAALRSSVDSIAPYGLAFDWAAEPVPGSSVAGYEALAQLPLLHPRLTLEGWYLTVPDALRRPYLPEYQWRGAFRFHAVLREGNFEPTFLAELHGRGRAMVPDLDGAAGSVAPYTLMRASLQLRIIDVRAFATVENVLFRAGIADVPGLEQPVLMRAVFGARWQFFN